MWSDDGYTHVRCMNELLLDWGAVGIAMLLQCIWPHNIYRQVWGSLQQHHMRGEMGRDGRDLRCRAEL